MSSNGPATVHYEVYILQDRRWVLHARYDREDRDAAIEDAKSVERTLGVAAKVIRDTYYPGNNISDEAVVYAGDKGLRDRAAMAPATPVYRGGAARGGATGGQLPQPFAQVVIPPKASTGDSHWSVLAKLLLIIAISMSISGALTALISSVLSRMASMGYQVSEQVLSLLIFIFFITIFLSAAVPLAMRLIDWSDNADTKRHGKKRNTAPSPAPQPTTPPAAASPPPPAAEAAPAEAFPSGDLDSEEDEQDMDWSEVDDSEALTELIPAIPELPPQEEAKPEAEKPKEEEAKAEEAPPAAAESPPEHVPATEDKDGLQDHRRSMMQFLSALVAAIKRVRPHLDAYNKFGLDLMLAGAVDVVGGKAHLTSDEKRIILKDTMEVMGTKPETAQAFAERYETYLMEPRYMAMVQIGRANMEQMMAGGDPAATDVTNAFESWNKPQSAQSQARIMTILFTDMVGSTDLTQSRGDQAAQDIVRRHNAIVRQALAENGGKEVKHTGDGIMASFASASNGVEAAIAIQRAVKKHNGKNRELPLELRIGINAGEPIEEEDDLFGSTVQLAARVCAAANPSQILCTNVVRELAAGKNRDFISQGAHALKGFKDHVALFEVEWAAPDKDDADEE